MLMDSCNRRLFAFLFLFTASKYDRSSGRGSSIFAAAQERPKYTTAPFTNTTHRTVVCDRFTRYANGSTDIRDLLEGLELSVGIVDQGNDIFFRLNRSDPDPNNWNINKTDPGIFVRILDELASRGKFSWRGSFAYVQPPRTNETNPATGTNYTWTDVLLDSVSRYDFSFAEWVHNQERRRLGISFPVGWFDASTILVQGKVEQISNFDLAAFLLPFVPEVWYLSCAVIFFSGVVYWILDKIEFPNDKIDTVVYDLFFQTLTITQHHIYDSANTHSKRLFGFSTALWSLVLAAAYTANLATVLVAEQRPLILAESLDEVAQAKLPLCIRAGAAVYSQVSSTFDNIDIRTEDTFDAVYESLRMGRCDLMASRAADFDAFKLDQFKNPDCTFEWVGRAQFIETGGPGTLVDTSNYCTSIVRHVLDVHMHEMIAEGRIAYLWKSHLNNLENNQACAASALEEQEALGQAYSLQLKDVGGVFIFHAVLILISFVVTLAESPWRRRQREKRRLLEEALARAARGDDSSHHEEDFPRPSMESLQSTRYMGGRPSMERLQSTRFSGSSGRPSMERLSSGYLRPVMDRRSSAKSLVYLAAEIDDSYRSYTAEDDEIHHTDDLLRSIKRMQRKIARLQTHGNNRMEGSDGTNTPRGSKGRAPPMPIIEDTEEDCRSDDHMTLVSYEEPSKDESSRINDGGGNPNEGKE